MSSNLPPWEVTPVKEPDIPPPEGDDVPRWPTRPAAKDGKQGLRPSSARMASRPQERAQQAIDDAQQGLQSLVNQPRDGRQPQVFSPSGALRNSRGRIAGPAERTTQPHRIVQPERTTPPAGYLLTGSAARPTRPLSTSELSLALAKDISAEVEDDETQEVPQTLVTRSLATASYQVQAIRDRAEILLSTNPQPATPAARRAAARWFTRYATHMIIVVVVGVLVALGGLRSLTVQSAFSGTMHAAAVGATDHFDDQDSPLGQPSADSTDYQLTLPRTDLSTPAGPQVQAAASVQQKPQGPVVLATKYTVARGDTIQSVAAKFHVMAETIMGSNGLYDPYQAINPGDTLMVPSVDGMYYVARSGDTLEGIAHRYQVEPGAISNFKLNNISGGTVRAGQAIVVPGGMMPPREQVLVYTVQKGDTLRAIAERFSIDVPTLIYANSLDNPDMLRIDQKLRILPVVGVQYKVQTGDTLRGIASEYGVPVQTVLDYAPNGLDLSSTLQPGQTIILPGGTPPPPPTPEPVVVAQAAPSSQQSSSSSGSSASSSSSSSSARSNSASSSNGSATAPKQKAQLERTSSSSAPPQPQPKPAVATQSDSNGSANAGSNPNPNNNPTSGTGRLMWPVQGVITQYFSSHHNGLDIAAPAGTPIYAADSGRVIWSGWRTDGLGNCVIIDHLDGIVTVYGHMIRQPMVYVGQYVVKGQQIGNVGSTGHSTGPHTHFMVKLGTGANYQNPLAYLP